MKAADRPPLWYWLIPAGVALLRELPLLSLRVWPLPEGRASLGVTYLPKDFLQYAAIAREVVEDGSFLFYNPFTTEPQSPRTLLLFHWLLGIAARLGGFSAVDALEWSRVPLAFLFFATLWWFLRPFLPERRDRLCGALLLGFATGFEPWLRPFAAWLPADLGERFLLATSGLAGWNLFSSFHNPLRIAALTAALVALRPLLVGGERSTRELLGIGAKLLLVYVIHPYTAIGVLAVAALQPFALLLCRTRPEWGRHLSDGAALGAALLVIGALNLWQMEDPVYRASAGGIVGGNYRSPLWYPLTLGLLGLHAWLGTRRAGAARLPQRVALLGWLLAALVLHTQPIVHGYKFVFLIPLPVCILAAPAAREALAGIRGPGATRRVLAAATALGLFGGAAFQTVEDVRAASSVSGAPAALMRVVETLATRPAGNALVPPLLGNALPAYSPHRVWLGHWFLTPGYYEREARYRRFVSDRNAAPELRRLVQEQRIRYLVVPAGSLRLVLEALGGAAVAERLPHGELELLVLR